jgi:trehalose 6-phosphate synthase/phosphatase
MARRIPGEAEARLQLPQPFRPSAPARHESGHPCLQPSVVNVPVTPGIHPGEYEYESPENNGGNQSPTSYFSPARRRGVMAQSPSEAASGATSNREILRRMSLTGQDPMIEADPRAANPSLGLSGGIISATFCIPHALHYRKGSDWVRSDPVSAFSSSSANHLLGIKPTPWHLGPL